MSSQIELTKSRPKILAIIFGTQPANISTMKKPLTKNNLLIKTITSSILVFSLNTKANSNDVCSKIYSDTAVDNTTDSGSSSQLKQLAASNGISQLLRSNPLHFWTWMQSSAPMFLSSDVLNIQGLIFGDPHNGNFMTALIKNQTTQIRSVQWACVDYDDGGKGPLILDFARYLASVKAVDDRVKSKDLWDAYLSGLNGEQKSPPDFIEKLLKLSPQEYEDLENDKAKKNSVRASQGRVLVRDNVENFDITDPQERNLIHHTFSSHLHDLQILDVVGRQKERGGSQEAKRYLALAKRNNGKYVLIELKENLEPAVNKYQSQSDDVFQIKLQTFSNSDSNYQEIRLRLPGDSAKQPPHSFLLRPKQLYLLDITNKVDGKNDLKKFDQLSQFNAWYIGSVQRAQASSTALTAILNSPAGDTTLLQIKVMVKQYLELLSDSLKKSQDKK